MFKRWRAPIRSWKNVLTVLESPGKVPELFVIKTVGTLIHFVVVDDCFCGVFSAAYFL